MSSVEEALRHVDMDDCFLGSGSLLRAEYTPPHDFMSLVWINLAILIHFRLRKIGESFATKATKCIKIASELHGSSFIVM